MDNYNPKRVLTELYQMVLSDIVIDEEMVEIIEEFFISILDNGDNEVFRCEQLHNLLFLLEYKNINTPLLNYLVHEIKIKSLRVSMIREYNRCLDNKNGGQKKCEMGEKLQGRSKPNKNPFVTDPKPLTESLDNLHLVRIFKENQALSENEL